MGLAPEAKILPIRDRGQRPGGFAIPIRYAVDHGATVINISQGGAEPPTDLKKIQQAIGYALQHNVVVVAATGNSGRAVGYPAALPGIVAVTGTTQSGEFWGRSNTGKQTLLSAPAERIVSAGESDSGYRLGTGTSDAAAYTSAAVALLKSKFPDLSAGQIVNRLTETAVVPGTDRHADQRDERWGYGAIRPLAALTADIPKGSTWGPLQVPTALKEKAAEKAQKKDEQAEIDKGQAQADRKAVIIWAVIGLVALIVIVLVILLIVRAVRKKNRPGGPGGFGGPGGPGMPGGGSYAAYPPGQQAAPGYAYPPQQQQQPPAPPQHNPYT
jgi:subtilisin family serine protease